MAIVKITELPAATSPVSPSDVAAIVQGGVTKKAAIDEFGFLQAGTNASVRTIQSKLRESLSVKDFGATGDGVTDDAPYIQAAINAAVAAQSANSVPGRQPASIYFPPGSYRINSTIDATTIGALIGESRDSVKILVNGAIGFSCGNSTSFYNLFMKGVTGVNIAAQWNQGYLAQITNCAFNLFATVLNFTGTFGGTKILINENNFDGVTTAVKFAGIVTTVAFQNNQCNTGTTVLDLPDCFNFVIMGNNFEDFTVGIKIRAQLTESQITGNWFEKNAAASVTPYEDLTNAPGFFTRNFFAGNRYVSTTGAVYGTTSVVADSGNLVIAPSNLSGYGDGRVYSTQSTEPTTVTTPAFTSPANYTLRTQNAVATQTAAGGDFIFRAGAGSNGARYGAFRPFTDANGSLGDVAARWEDTYSQRFRPGAGAVIWTSGSGTPEGAVTAPVGSLFTRTDGGANTTLYVKESGSSNTGWVAK